MGRVYRFKTDILHQRVPRRMSKFKCRMSFVIWLSSFAIFLLVVALRVELSATWLSAAFGQPALDYRDQIHRAPLQVLDPTSANQVRGGVEKNLRLRS